LTALLFVVRGPVQAVLPGEGLGLAWTLYILVGSLVVVGVGLGFSGLRKVMKSLKERTEKKK